MSVRLGSVAAVAEHLRVQGNTVEATVDRLIAVAPIGSRLSSVELRWQTKTGSIHAFEILPHVVPIHAITAVTAVLMTANAQLGMPGFQLRQSPGGWRVVYMAYAFLDEDGTVAPRVVDEIVRAVRVNAAAYLPQVAARVAETERPDEALELARFGRRNPQLAASELDALRAAVTRELPDFAPRLHQAMLVEIEQPFFRHTRIIEVTSPLPVPARVVYTARLADGQVLVLSGRPDALRALCASDRPVCEHRDAALVLANVIAVWIVDELGELRIASFDDIPWRADLGLSERARVDAVRAAHARSITAPVLDSNEGEFVLRYWSVARSLLVRRQIRITATALDVTTEVVAELPVPPGRVWSVVEGREVPTG